MWADESKTNFNWIHQVSTQTNFIEENIKVCFIVEYVKSVLNIKKLLKLQIKSQYSLKNPKAKKNPHKKTPTPTTQAGSINLFTNK